jgi:hypothetical protein
MATETKATQSEMENIRQQVAAARARIARYRREHPGEPFPFTKMRGVLRGKVHFTDEEIEAAKIRPRDLPPE